MLDNQEDLVEEVVGEDNLLEQEILHQLHRHRGIVELLEMEIQVPQLLVVEVVAQVVRDLFLHPHHHLVVRVVQDRLILMLMDLQIQ
jgi:hypothetical protein